MKRLASLLLMMVPCFGVYAQEGGFSVSGSYVRGLLSLGSVNNTLDRTVFDWNRFFGLSMGPFDHFNSLATFTGRLGFRFDRDYEAFVSYFRFSEQMNNGYNGPSTDGSRYNLSLERSLGSENLGLGIMYFFPPIVFEADAYAFIEVGRVSGFAEAKTFGTHTIKYNEADSTFIFHDVTATYAKTRMFFGVGTGVSIEVVPSVRASAELTYKLAKLGQMDGTITVESGTFNDPSISEFDFSVLLFCIGLRIDI